jgi:ribosomal protein L37AE/L43A
VPVDRVREALDHLDFEDWLRSHGCDLKPGGGDERRVKECPECGDDRHKLYVNVVKKVWLCYVCDWGRGLHDPVHLMAAITGKTTFQIKVELAQTVIPVPAGNIHAQLQAILDPPEAPSVRSWSMTEIELPGSDSWTALSSHPTLNYAYRRGLTPEMVSHLGLRHAAKLPTNKGYDVPGPWLVFPVHIAGAPVSWQGRRVQGDRDPKYLGNTNIHDWLWPLGDLFFSTYQARGLVILVEGVFDALGFLLAGYAALCTFGKSVSEQQQLLLQELQPSEVVFAWDLDAEKATGKAIDRVAHIFPAASVVDFADPPASVKRDPSDPEEKVDAGDALVRPQVAQWLMDRLGKRLNMRSMEFLQWRMMRMT